MNETFANKSRSSFSSLVDRVARELMAIKHQVRHSVISTPLMYPSGSSVVVRINDAGTEYFVTDFGMGYEEASMLGASNIFVRYGKAVAEAAGIGFDGRAFFINRITESQLAGAVVTVANCSQETVTIAAFKSADRRREAATDALYKRLNKAFPARNIAKDVRVYGRLREWHVATMVKREERSTIFEPVSAHHTSIFAASAKFRDIGGVDDAPARVAVVRNKEDLKDNLLVISQDAMVIDRDVSSEVYQKLAEAA